MLDKRKEKREMRQLIREKLRLPRYTLGEEIANAITHGLGAVFGVAALVILLVVSPHDAVTVVSVSLYGATLFLLYTVSTVYHALGLNRAKKVFQVLDHCTIYLLIAGTYTPICLVSMGRDGKILFTIVWTVAVAGIVLNALDMKRFRVISMVFYLGLGWCILLFLKPLLEALDSTSITWLIAGGVVYTVGSILYGLGRKIPYMHSVFHLFCLAGSAFHFIVIYRVCLP